MHASSELPLKYLSQSSPFRRVCSDTTPFIAALIEAATGAEMWPYSIDAGRIYARNDRKKAPYTNVVAGLGSQRKQFAELGSSKSCYLTAPRKSAGDAGILALICIKDGVADGMIRIRFMEVVLCSPECSPQTPSARVRSLSLRSPSHSSSPSRHYQRLPSSRGRQRRTSPSRLTVTVTCCGADRDGAGIPSW